MNMNINGTHYVLAALRELRPKCRFYFAGSSEMFGNVNEVPQKETTAFQPRSPYGISKVAGFHLTRNYREAYGLYCVSGILFNHESPRRGFEFVTRKTTSTVARIKLGSCVRAAASGISKPSATGATRKITCARCTRCCSNRKPDDFVIATGQTHSVRELCEMAFAEVDLDYREFVKVDERYYRPAEVDLLIGDASKARRSARMGADLHFPRADQRDGGVGS